MGNNIYLMDNYKMREVPELAQWEQASRAELAGSGPSVGHFHWSACPVPAPDPCRGHDSSL